MHSRYRTHSPDSSPGADHHSSTHGNASRHSVTAPNVNSSVHRVPDTLTYCHAVRVPIATSDRYACAHVNSGVDRVPDTAAHCHAGHVPLPDATAHVNSCADGNSNKHGVSHAATNRHAVRVE